MYFNEDHQALRETVARFVAREINPYMDEWEERTAPLHALFEKMGALGLLGVRYDPAYGGQGLDYWFDTVFLEELGHIRGMGVTAAIMDHTHMATPAIHEFGSAFLKDTYLRPAIAGKAVSAIAVTEPGAGSDVGALRTRARKDGDAYVLNGSKTFITNGVQADFVTVLARTGDQPGYHAFSLLVVPKGLAGFEVRRNLDKIGCKSSDMAELFFEDVRVPAENRIGAEGEGFIYQMRQFQHERFAVLPVTYVMTRDMIDLTVDYLRQRATFGKPLIQRQVLRHRLADWLTAIESLKQLTYHIVRLKMAGADATREVSMGKLISGELAMRVADGCLQMFGGMGYMNESLISRYYRDARSSSIAGGTNEIMREVIARLEGY
ncbi:MAG: acyl-CoA dehydrogenase family protein [bacterium]